MYEELLEKGDLTEDQRTELVCAADEFEHCFDEVSVKLWLQNSE